MLPQITLLLETSAGFNAVNGEGASQSVVLAPRRQVDV